MESPGQNLCNGSTMFKYSSVLNLIVCLISFFVCLIGSHTKIEYYYHILYIIYKSPISPKGLKSCKSSKSLKLDL